MVKLEKKTKIFFRADAVTVAVVGQTIVKLVLHTNLNLPTPKKQ
jgi:hypothetical protein